MRLWTVIAACMAVTVAGGVAVPSQAMASPAVLAQAADTTIDEKYLAAAVLGWVPREEVTLTDRDFVTVLWEKASEKHNPAVKAAALAAFSDATDAEAASAEFIRAGIFAANDQDAALKARKAELDTLRLRAAQEINWVPATTAERTTMLDQTLQNFLLALWRKAATWPEVKAAAEPLTVADATDEQRLDFLQHALFDKAEADRQNEIANGNAEELAAREAAALRSAKEKAVATALKRSATPYELDELELRELIHLFAAESTGRKVKSDATVAYANSAEQAWIAFVFTGVHLANRVDLDERDLAEARANEVKVRDIMYAAEADGFKPTVVTTAKKALEGVALDRSLYLLEGHDTARQADFIRPSADRTVMIQANGYNGCIARPTRLQMFARADVRLRVDPCNENNLMQRWLLKADTTAGRYKLLNAFNGTWCPFPERAKVQQDGAPIMTFDCWNPPSGAPAAADVWELLDGGQGNVEIRNVTNNKVITAVAGSAAGSLTVVQNPNGHTATQQWRLIDPSHQGNASKPPTGSFRLKNVKSGRCLRPAGALDKPGQGGLASWVNLEVRDCGSGTEQIWDVATLSDTRFTLRNRASQYCAILGDDDDAEMALLRQAGCTSTNAPWVAMFTKASGLYLRSGANGDYLSLRDGGTANGTLATTMEYSTITDEQWVLEPVSDGATQPKPSWVSPGKPITSYAGTAVTFQPECSGTGVQLSFGSSGTSPKPVRAHVANPIKNLVRADIATGGTTENNFQVCVVASPTSSKLEVTLKSTASKAFVREVTNPSAGLVADQTNAANAERFILQLRGSKVRLNLAYDVLQSKKTNKYAVPDTAATGTLNGAIRFTSATPVAAAELGVFW